jgi:hypothetical protein
MHPVRPAGDPDAAEPLHAGRLDGPAARVVGEMSRPEFEISTDWTGHAKPGHWYGRYYADWEAAHPGAWVRGELVPGGFYNGNRWGGSTLSWDANWFSKHGAKMPKGVHYIAPGRSMTRLTEKLNPSDTGVMRLQFRDDCWRVCRPSVPAGTGTRRCSSRRSSEVAASHREHGPRDVGGLIGGEEGDRRGLLVQGPVPLEQR